MSMVKFATRCDRCGRRSEEYTTWPSCRECQQDVCSTCASPGSLQDHERDVSDELYGTYAIHYETVLCAPCAQEAA